MIDRIILGLSSISLIFLIISIIMIVRSLKFESLNNKVIFNLLLVGLFFILIVVAYDFVISLKIFGTINQVLQQLPLTFLSNIIELLVIPVAALCFIVAMINLRELAKKGI